METKTAQTKPLSHWRHTIAGAIRVAFGMAWGIDAFLKWQPDFFNNYLSYITGIISGQPSWLLPWFNFWGNLIQMNPDLFAWLTRIIETLIAAGLLLGLFRKWVYLLGALFALLIWSIPEGFGGPYTPGATDVGGGLIYVFMFMGLILIDYMMGKSPYSMDYYIEKKLPSWRYAAEWAPTATLEQEPVYLPWGYQIITIIGLIVMLGLFLYILGSELNSAPPSTGLVLGWCYNVIHAAPLIG
jgi:nitrite reductase (NO-forming)